MPEGDASTMRSLGRFFGRVRAGFLDGLRGGGDGPGAPSPDGDHPDAGGDSGTESSPRVVARRTTVIEEVHIINEERR